MAWKIEFLPEAERELAKLDTTVIRRILNFLDNRLKLLEDPRSIGEALKGQELGKYWKYRVGDYRLICSVQDDQVRVLVVRIGHRREVYR